MSKKSAKTVKKCSRRAASGRATTRAAAASAPISSKKTRKQSKRGKRTSINSRQKGAGGERELANLLTEHGIQARRGQQHAGGVESPDVTIAAGLPFHFECKRVQRGNPYNWLAQAANDAGNKIPIVAHRRNGRRWIAVIFLDDFLNYVVT